MAKKKHSNSVLSIVGGVFVVLVIVSIAFASTYISSQLSSGNRLAPNAPESEPEAAGKGCLATDGGKPTTRCNNNILQTCIGGNWTKTETCALGCCAGECITKVICTPGKTRCSGANIQTCDRYGGCWTNTTDCKPFTCNPKNGECTVCVPGEKKCSGNILKTCNSDGSKLDSTDCGIGKVCKNSACKSIPTCTSEEVEKCGGIPYDSSKTSYSNAYLCIYSGTRMLCCNSGYFYMMGSCAKEDSPTPTPTKEAPKPTATPTPTATQICTPGASKCSGTYSYTCNSTGTAWGSAVNCSPYKVCNSSTGKCAAPIE